MGRPVAIKQVKNIGLHSDELTAFHAEITMLTHIRHPRIVQFYGIINAESGQALVMELLSKGSLSLLIRHYKKQLSLSDKVRIALDVAYGIEYLHKVRVISLLRIDYTQRFEMLECSLG